MKVNFNFMTTVSLLDFRRNARRILAAVGRGQRLVLTVRGKPVARLEPIRDDAPRGGEDDPMRRLDEFTVDGPGGPLRNREIDRHIYGA
jgi:prevent-host-death family protein